MYSYPEISFLLHSKQAPDYRLYKSEPELTTVNEEVDETNGEEKDKAETESKDGASSKGTFINQCVTLSGSLILAALFLLCFKEAGVS